MSFFSSRQGKNKENWSKA